MVKIRTRSIFPLVFSVSFFIVSSISGQALVNSDVDFPRLSLRVNTGLINHNQKQYHQMPDWKYSIIKGFGVDVALSRTVLLGINWDILNQQYGSGKIGTEMTESGLLSSSQTFNESQYVKTLGVQLSIYPDGFNHRLFRPYFSGGISRIYYSFHNSMTLIKTTSDMEIINNDHMVSLNETSRGRSVFGFNCGIGVDFFPRNWLNPFLECKAWTTSSRGYKGNLIFAAGVKAIIL